MTKNTLSETISEICQLAERTSIGRLNDGQALEAVQRYAGERGIVDIRVAASTMLECLVVIDREIGEYMEMFGLKDRDAAIADVVERSNMAATQRKIMMERVDEHYGHS